LMLMVRLPNGLLISKGKSKSSKVKIEIVTGD